MYSLRLLLHSVYGKAFSVFGRELDMITQDSLRFYKDHAVYQNFGGVVLDREEGRKIAECLGDGKAVILQNHGLITVCFSGRCCTAQLANVDWNRSANPSMLPPFGSCP